MKKNKDLRFIDNCVECAVERQTTFTHDGLCVGCMSQYMDGDEV